MKDLIVNLLAVYLIMFILVFLIGNLLRIDGSNCKIVVGDYVFLGLTRLPCEVK